MELVKLEIEIQQLINEFGVRPYDFFTILSNSENPNIDIIQQNAQWADVKAEAWHSLNLSSYYVWAISDNGDLLWWNGSQTIAMNPRDSLFVSEPVNPRQFIRLVRMGKIGQIFPKSLEVNNA
ncbi:hypothetical protein MTYP_00118 [Methylophilaceae bacterium]|nr:hypothetical protein MTYP_00118 [Methylophilaceae bacterium]